MPHLKFKVAACLYVIGQGGPLKVLADACSFTVSFVDGCVLLVWRGLALSKKKNRCVHGASAKNLRL